MRWWARLLSTLTRCGTSSTDRLEVYSLLVDIYVGICCGGCRTCSCCISLGAFGAMSSPTSLGRSSTISWSSDSLWEAEMVYCFERDLL